MWGEAERVANLKGGKQPAGSGGGGGGGGSKRLYLGGNHFGVAAQSVLRELSKLGREESLVKTQSDAFTVAPLCVLDRHGVSAA